MIQIGWLNKNRIARIVLDFGSATETDFWSHGSIIGFDFKSIPDLSEHRFLLVAKKTNANTLKNQTWTDTHKTTIHEYSIGESFYRSGFPTM